MPTATAELAPIAQYHRMVWKAAARPMEKAERKGPSLPGLWQLWAKAEKGFTPLVAVVQAAGITFMQQGAIKQNAKGKRRAWDRVQDLLRSLRSLWHA